MEFNEEQIKALECFIKKEISNKMLIDKIKDLKTEVENLIERDGWRLESRIEKLVNTNDAFLIEEPQPEPDYGHIDDPEQVM